MSLPDYRIRFPSARIDFDEDVYGGSPDGQEINDFPKPGQARFDWHRLVMIGLLANQSSEEEPANYKVGTLWFNLASGGFFNYFNGTDFAEIAEAIGINGSNLKEWSELVDETVGKVTESASFTGVAQTNNLTIIDVPGSALAAASYSNNHPVLYKNDLLVDPRLTAFNLDRNKVLLLDNEIGSVSLRKNDRYTILIQRLDTVVSETVVVS